MSIPREPLGDVSEDFTVGARLNVAAVHPHAQTIPDCDSCII